MKNRDLSHDDFDKVFDQAFHLSAEIDMQLEELGDSKKTPKLLAHMRLLVNLLKTTLEVASIDFNEIGSS